MSFTVEISICVTAWALTLVRFRAIRWRDIWRDNGIALNVWLMMVFFSITTIFLIKRFSDYFDVHTMNNLDRLIAYCSVLIGIYFGASASVEAVGTPMHRRLLSGLRNLLISTIAGLLAIYALFLSKIPNMDYLVPRSLPEAVFLFIAFFLGAVLSAFVGKVYLGYIGLEESDVMRTRSLLIVASAWVGSAYFLVKTATVTGYFWPALAFPVLIDLSTILLISTILLHFSSLLSNKIYVPVVLLSRKIASWSTFRDLQHLAARLQRLCPDVAFSPPAPTFGKLLADPEYYLYRSVVAIMDGKTMLDDLLLEGALQEPALWEGDLVREALQIQQALQCLDPSEDFWEMVGVYQRASQNLRRKPNIRLQEPSS
jgi:hypothetical protein